MEGQQALSIAGTSLKPLKNRHQVSLLNDTSPVYYKTVPLNELRAHVFS